MRLKTLCLWVVSALCLASAALIPWQLVLGQEGALGTNAAYDNVEILSDASPEQLQQIMEAITVSLGVECEYCHVAGNPASDAKPAKDTARQMMRMLSDVGASYFEALEAPSCWTCHRGSPVPETEPISDELPTNERPVRAPFSDEVRPARDVYGNIQQYESLPAAALQDVMEAYSRALGVSCDHCHDVDQWADDSVLMKLMSRRMFEIQEALVDDYLGSQRGVTCWTCHRGETLPQTNLPPALLPGDR